MKRLAWLMPLQVVFTVHALACNPAINEDLNNDGRVDFSDTLIVARSYRLEQDDPRYNLLADTDCSGAIDRDDLNFVKRGLDETYPIKPNVQGFLKMPEEIKLTTGESGMLQVFVKMESLNDIPFSVNLKQTSAPDRGLFLKPPAEEPPATGNKLKHTYRIPIDALEPGRYTLTTTALIGQSGQRFTDTSTIEVMPAARPVSEALTLTLMHSNAGAQKPGSSLLAHVTIENDSIEPIGRLEIQDAQEQRSWKLTASGRNRYSARLLFDDPQVDRCMTLIAVATIEKGEIASPGVHYCFEKTQTASSADGMKLSLHASSPTPAPNARILAEVTLTGTLPNRIARVDIQSKADRNRWTLAQKGSGIFRGRITLDEIKPGQCLDMIAEGFDRTGRLIASDSQPQPLCQEDRRGNPASP